MYTTSTMAASSKHVMLLLVASFLLATSSAGESPRKLLLGTDDNVTGSGGALDCWNALTEIKSCSGEIAAYFMSGGAHIGPDCCRAIAVITRSCWPAILTALGFTSDEAYVLRGYCDAALSAGVGAADGPAAQGPSV